MYDDLELVLECMKEDLFLPIDLYVISHKVYSRRRWVKTSLKQYSRHGTVAAES